MINGTVLRNHIINDVTLLSFSHRPGVDMADEVTGVENDFNDDD